MDIVMDREKLKALAKELAKDIKTEADLNMLSRELVKLTVETALNAELTEHLGYEKHADSKPARGNSRGCKLICVSSGGLLTSYLRNRGYWT